MTRAHEFSPKVKRDALKRAMNEDGTIVRCEKCGGVCKSVEFDHIKPLAMGGESTLDNC